MRTCHAHDKRWFPNRDKSNSVVNGHELESKLLCRLFCNSFQLVLRHFTMRLVFDSIDFAAVFKSPHRSPKLDDRSGIAMKAFSPRLKRRFGYQNFTNDICHELETLATVITSLLSSHKRRYQNEHESM